MVKTSSVQIISPTSGETRNDPLSSSALAAPSAAASGSPAMMLERSIVA